MDLTIFELRSELKINYDKSHIIFLGVMNVDNLIVEKIIGYKKGSFPIKI